MVFYYQTTCMSQFLYRNVIGLYISTVSHFIFEVLKKPKGFHSINNTKETIVTTSFELHSGPHQRSRAPRLCLGQNAFSTVSWLIFSNPHSQTEIVVILRPTPDSSNLRKTYTHSYLILMAIKRKLGESGEMFRIVQIVIYVLCEILSASNLLTKHVLVGHI